MKHKNIINDLEEIEFRIGFGQIIVLLADLALKCAGDCATINDVDSAAEYTKIREILKETAKKIANNQ